MSHHRCGEDRRHVFTEVYSRTCAVKNHASVRNEVNKESLMNPGPENEYQFQLVDACMDKGKT